MVTSFLIFSTIFIFIISLAIGFILFAIKIIQDDGWQNIGYFTIACLIISSVVILGYAFIQTFIK